jgi:uncharacterized phage protein gp47/JayE
MAYGLLATGFSPKPNDVLIDEIEGRVRADIGVTPVGRLKKLIAVFANSLSDLWELAEAVHAAGDPDAADGVALEQLCALTGTTREAARASTVTLTLTGTPTTVVPAGSRASTAATEMEFATAADATITAAAAWASSTAYVLGDRRTHDGNVYQVTTAGTSASSGGPTGTDAAIADNTVVWRYLGEGTGVIDAEASSVVLDEVVAESGDIVTIETPVGGWSGVINVLDADLGAPIETDESLRMRRELELSAAGGPTPDAIRAALLDLDGVTSATVFYNDTDGTVDGMPPHSVEALVRGGDDQDIFDCLLANVAAGVKTHGTETGTAVDSEGTSHAMEFSRPDEIEIYVDINVTYDATLWPTDGDDQIAAAIVAWGDARNTGADAVASAISAQAFKVAGVFDVTDVDIGTSASPTVGTTIAISPRELAVYDTSRIVVTATPGTP